MKDSHLGHLVFPVGSSWRPSCHVLWQSVGVTSWYGAHMSQDILSLHTVCQMGGFSLRAFLLSAPLASGGLRSQLLSPYWVWRSTGQGQAWSGAQVCCVLPGFRVPLTSKVSIQVLPSPDQRRRKKGNGDPPPRGSPKLSHIPLSGDLIPLGDPQQFPFLPHPYPPEYR